MILTKKKALDKSIELWEWLAETGAYKHKWPKWEQYGEMENDCFLCEYQEFHRLKGNLCNCPLADSEHSGCYAYAYKKWEKAKSPQALKKYAREFLAQLKEIRDDNSASHR